jgi:ParB family chromosome partitioning protein
MSDLKKDRGLGFGADLLGLDELLTTTVDQYEDPLSAEVDGGIRYVAYHKIKPGPAQPRQTMNDEALVELARSIRQHGLIQPIVVQADVGLDTYRIVAGERRWRAAKLANLQQVPVIVRDFTEKQAVAVALIENMQREDLNVVDQAKGLQRLLADFSLTHKEVAHYLGKSRATISNILRLLALEDAILDHLAVGDLDMGHARCLLALPVKNRTAVAKRVIAEQWSVRTTERFVQNQLQTPTKTTMESGQAHRQQQWHTWAESLKAQIAMPVRIRQGRGKKVNLEVCCEDDVALERLIALVAQFESNQTSAS